jgi:hypothetical protein
MPGIRSHNRRDALPKWAQYPLRYRDIELAFAAFTDYDLRLCTSFFSCKQPGSRDLSAADATYWLAHFVHWPEGPSYSTCDPGQDAAKLVIVDVCVKAIPRQLDSEAKPSRPALRRLLGEYVPLLADSVRKQLWELRLLLLMCPPRIQVSGSHGADREYLVATLNGVE